MCELDLTDIRKGMISWGCVHGDELLGSIKDGISWLAEHIDSQGLCFMDFMCSWFYSSVWDEISRSLHCYIFIFSEI